MKKLTVHNIQTEERLIIAQTNYPLALSEVDKTVLFLAERLNAIVLSSDKAVRNFANLSSIIILLKINYLNFLP